MLITFSFRADIFSILQLRELSRPTKQWQMNNVLDCSCYEGRWEIMKVQKATTIELGNVANNEVKMQGRNLSLSLAASLQNLNL
jgi:hypothetical protein